MSVVLKQLQNSARIDPYVILAELVIKHSTKILEAQKEQLKSGRNADGKKITPKYASKSYGLAKNKMNSLPGLGTPDLFLTGELYRRLDLIVGVPNDKEYTIFSDVDYFNDLLDKYANVIGIAKKQ